MKKFRYEDTFITSNIFECTCEDFSHTFKVDVIGEGKSNEIFSVECSLDEKASILKRIRIAFKYIFTGRSWRWDRVMRRDDMIALMKQLEVHFGNHKGIRKQKPSK